MLRRFIENTEGADVYAIIGLIIFILMFAGIVAWVFLADKNYIRRMKNLPLEDDDSKPDKNTTGENDEIK